MRSWRGSATQPRPPMRDFASSRARCRRPAIRRCAWASTGAPPSHRRLEGFAVPSSDPSAAQPPRRLERPSRRRLIGGVCSGLGDHFGVDPLLLRIAFVALAIFAGVGFWLYVAIFLLVPEE